MFPQAPVKRMKRFIEMLFLLVLGFSSMTGAMAAGSDNLDKTEPNDATKTGAFDVREDYRRANKLAIPFGPSTKRNSGGMDEIKDRESQGPDQVDHGSPVYAWPVVIPSATSAVPTKRDKGITKNRMKTFGMPISDTQYQIIHRMNQQIMLEEMFDPERIMWLGACMGASQVQDSANSFANVVRNQADSAINFVACPIYNFTTEGGNKWNKIRDQIFMPMAVLLLLPGAMLAQVRVIVAAGMPIGGSDVSPFEGITRSIVAIFLIPATYLIVNYGLDLNNSLTYTIANEYNRIFHTNMYKDALCLIIRGFPIRQAQENRNGLYKEVVPWTDSSGSDGTPASGLESEALKVKVEDPCSGEFNADPDHSDEQAPFHSITERFVVNASDAVLAMTWNVLCAFQMVFLMYLWLVGPVIAALWVYPHDTLRSAFPGWVEGVITLCFWALFWNTTVLLMACFRGVDSTGSIVSSALLFLSVQSVKSAFDFAGLVKEAAKTAGEMMSGATSHMAGKATPGVAGGGKDSHGGHSSGSKGGSHGASHGSSHGSSHAGSTGGGHSGAMAVSKHGPMLGGTHGPSSGAGPGASHSATGHGNLSTGGTFGTHLNIHESSTHSSSGVSGAGLHSGNAALPGAGGGHAPMGAEKGSDHTHGGLAPGQGSSMAGEKGGPGDHTPLASPPMTQAGDVNVSNLSSMSSMNNDINNSFNASTLTGNVPGTDISAREAAGLIGQNNLANFPQEGAAMSKEIANQNFNAAMKETEMRNAREGGVGPDAAKRDELMGAWKHDLDLAEQNPSASGNVIGMPDTMVGTAAGGNWEMAAASYAANTLPQGMDSVMNSVGGALATASAGLAQGYPVNPQAVEGLASLAREVTQVGPEMSGMSPVAIGATMEAWQQKSEVLSQQLTQPSDTPMSGETYARLQTAQTELAQFQQAYSVASGGPAMPPSADAYGGGAGYAQGGGGFGGYADNSGYAQGGGGYAQSGYAGDPTGGASSSAGSPDQSYYNQSYYGSGGTGYNKDAAADLTPYQPSGGASSGSDPGYAGAQQQQVDSSTYSQPGGQPDQVYYQQNQIDQSAYYQQSQTGDAGANYQQQQQADQTAYYQQQQQADQAAYYQQQQQQADQSAYYQQQQQQPDQSVYYPQQQPQQGDPYGQGGAYYPQPEQSSGYGYAQGADSSGYVPQAPQPEQAISFPWQASQAPEAQSQHQQSEYSHGPQPEYGTSGGGYGQQQQQPQAHHDAPGPFIPMPNAANPASARPADKPLPPKPEPKPASQQNQKEAEKRMQNPLNYIKKPDGKKKKIHDDADGPPPPANPG